MQLVGDIYMAVSVFIQTLGWIGWLYFWMRILWRCSLNSVERKEVAMGFSGKCFWSPVLNGITE